MSRPSSTESLAGLAPHEVDGVYKSGGGAGRAFGELTEAIRRDLTISHKRMTALGATEVDIVVGDVHIERDGSKEMRVQ